MRLKNTQWLWIALFGFTSLTACQKELENVIDAPPVTPVEDSEADKIKDTVLAYSRAVYLWYDQIPASFDPRSYAGPQEIMQAIRQYSAEPGFTGPVDKWSFAIKQAEWDDVSSGIAGDFGLDVFYRSSSDLRVRNVEEESPAGKAGVRRGWRITALNGNTNVDLDNLDAVVDVIYESENSVAFKFEKPDGSVADITLSIAQYKQKPVALDTVYTVGGKNIGYMVYNSFLGDTTEIANRFDEVFNRFAAGNVADVVVDLRYNGGGYVLLQDKLAGYLLPASANGDVLMKQDYNNNFPTWDDTTYVQKKGSLNLSRIFFIVSSNSASASELIINNLKPYMDVKLIGPNETYGKPVGYFDIPVGDWYIFPVSSRSTNKLGSGNYFNGFAVDSKVADGLDKDWGDVSESCLAKAIQYITTGSFTPRIQGRGKDVFVEQPEELRQANSRIGKNEFRGMIYSKRK